MTEFSETWTYKDEAWHEGNVPVVGAREHAFWLGSSVFDGARAFEGVTPDLDLHCERLNRSAEALRLKAHQNRRGDHQPVPGRGCKIRTRCGVVHPADVLCLSGWPPWRSPHCRESTKFIIAVYVTPMSQTDGFQRDSFTVPPTNPGMHAVGCQGRGVCIPTMPGL